MIGTRVRPPLVSRTLEAGAQRVPPQSPGGLPTRRAAATPMPSVALDVHASQARSAQLCQQIMAGQLQQLQPPRWCNVFSADPVACASTYVQNPLMPEAWMCEYDTESHQCRTGPHFSCHNPPPPPMPPMVPVPTAPPCSDGLAGCMQSRCCKDPAFGCFRRRGTGHTGEDAVCMPLTQECSTETGGGRDWLCPGWDSCARPYGDCFDSGCWQQPSQLESYGHRSQRFECLKRPDRMYAQCRPLAVINIDALATPTRPLVGVANAKASRKPTVTPTNAPTVTPSKTACTDTNDWLCPSWSACGEALGDCSQSGCCVDLPHQDFGCYKRPYGAAAQCRPYTSEEACADTDEWLCPGWEWDHCSSPGQSCSSSYCCNRRDFTCYMGTDNEGICLRCAAARRAVRGLAALFCGHVRLLNARSPQ